MNRQRLPPPCRRDRLVGRWRDSERESILQTLRLQSGTDFLVLHSLNVWLEDHLWETLGGA